jgi:hypothetical protein
LQYGIESADEYIDHDKEEQEEIKREILTGKD